MKTSKMLIKRYKTRIFSLITVFFSLIAIVVCSELLLRLTGHPPYKLRSFNPVHESDPKLGWKNREGKYFFPDYTSSKKMKYAVPAYALNSKELTFSTGGTLTFLPGGMRTTGAEKLDKRRQLVIVGGSFTQGYAISDNETFSWKLQSRYPSVQVLNFGTGGYGTYQSLLTIERLFSSKMLSEPPIMILYGFIGHHEVRNIAPSELLKRVGRRIGQEYRGIPYCTIDSENNLIKHPVEIYPKWPLTEKLATVNFFQTLYMKLKTWGRDSQKRRVTEKLLLEMNSLCQKKGTQFAVILLSCNTETKFHYINFLKNNHINYIDCVYPLTSERQVPVDGHPNRVMNTLWADCIGEALGDTITQEVGRQ
ncbi:exported protein [Candidatus Thiomargarita nelsonii]|uniref:Exported protein n=1 Tax=Candidatus Thiomargarita nelsonii TaxID=1003181 RepID=A0A176S871_9GAMM|nr:exported protein [Candidatus Thiomargarita nelsonii]